ncbi:MAG: hypothetical protein V4506_11365 [Bacteroidota bacterium]
MKKDLKFSCLLIALFISCAVRTQTPGYMGKRFALSYGFYFSPAIIGANAHGKTMVGRDNSKSESGTFAFNTQHQLGIEYVLKNHISVGFATTYYRTMYDNSYELGSGNIPSGNYNITGINYALYFKFYRKAAIAPYGKYFMIGVTLNTTKSTYDRAYMKPKIQSSIPFENDFGYTTQKYKMPDLVIGWGKNRIIADRVLIDYGINLQLLGTLNALFGPESFDLDDNSFGFHEGNYVSNYIHNTSRLRSREVNKFNVFLKVGVLLF